MSPRTRKDGRESEARSALAWGLAVTVATFGLGLNACGGSAEESPVPDRGDSMESSTGAGSQTDSDGKGSTGGKRPGSSDGSSGRSAKGEGSPNRSDGGERQSAGNGGSAAGEADSRSSGAPPEAPGATSGGDRTGSNARASVPPKPSGKRAGGGGGGGAEDGGAPPQPP